ncbi:hypothetical protein ACMG4P_08030 [Pseudovibrio denitrificans]|uniref:hypothetical protein n=1 Tax=Pseudovibrio denitrificans TaxID=258256 RepID=UPI0039BF6BE1
MFVVIYRNSILGLGESEEQVISDVLLLLSCLPEDEKSHVINHLQVAAISQHACKQITSDRSVTLKRVDGVLEAI